MHLGYGPLAAEAHGPVELHGTYPAGQRALVRPLIHLGEEFLRRCVRPPDLQGKDTLDEVILSDGLSGVASLVNVGLEVGADGLACHVGAHHQLLEIGRRDSQ